MTGFRTDEPYIDGVIPPGRLSHEADFRWYRGGRLTTSAFAADLAPRPYTKAPPPIVAVYDRTGFYVGGNIGYSWGRSSDTSSLTNDAGTILFASTDKTNLNGVVGGGQAGYNWQMQNWVWGLESDIQGTGEKGSRGFTCPTGTCLPSTILPGFNALVIVVPGGIVPLALSQKIDWFGTVRGRVGILADPKVLLYATGGLAYGEINTSETIGGVAGLSSTTTNVGWTVGAGVEGVIGGNWTAKLDISMSISARHRDRLRRRSPRSVPA